MDICIYWQLKLWHGNEFVNYKMENETSLIKEINS